MIDVALLSVIRRWRLRDQMPIREIARRTGLSRNTIKKYLASGEVEPRYAKRQSASKLDEYADKLTHWLKIESNRNRKQRRSLKQLYQDLLALGYEGSYDRVCAFAKHWRQTQAEASKTAGRGVFIPLSFSPGEAFQFDWSEDWAIIDGKRTKFQIAHFKLAFSRAFLLRAYPLQTHEMLFDAHQHAFDIFGGVPKRGIYDNMRTAVDKVLSGKQRDINARFAAMVSHYLFDPEFCNPASGWEKGQIEKNVQDSRHRIWHIAPGFDSLTHLNHWLTHRCLMLWESTKHPDFPHQTISQVWEEERNHLIHISQPFDGFVEHIKRVSPTCFIHVERNRYSVPASFANRPVNVRIYAERIVVVAEGRVIAEHPRTFDRDHRGSRTCYDWRHYLAVLQRKPGALRNGAPFQEMPAAFLRLQTHLLKRPGGDREMVEILALVLHHDERLVLAAVELALESGVISKHHVLNLLGRLMSSNPPDLITAPQALKLNEEPQPNVGRYDRLRRDTHAA